MAVANSGASLSAANTTGPGATITFTSVCKSHAQAVTVTGFAGTGGAKVHIELSQDGVTWFTPKLGGAKYVKGNGTYQMHTREDYPALYARGNLFAIDPGVTAITVSSIIASE